MDTQHSFPDSASMAFKVAIQNFKNALKNDNLYNEILQTTSIEQVYDLTDSLQVEQAKRNDIKHLSKIKPYLDRLEAYTGAINTFVQVKPDILALIWGPIKLLIQWASTLSASLVALIDMAAQIGYLLPEFGHAKRMFGENEQINLLLALFFQDILDFYLLALKFFSMPRLKLLFEALWPKKKPEIENVMNRIGRHTTMLRNEVRLEDIEGAYEARASEIEHFEKLYRNTRKTEYGVLETAMAPRFYYNEIDRFRGHFCEGTGNWLLKHITIQEWIDISQKETEISTRVIWLRGIPGAGKTFLSFCIIDKVQSQGALESRIIFAFLRHSLSLTTSALTIVHSLIFQLAREDPILQDLVCEISRESLSSNLGAATSLLIKLLNSAGPMHIVIDGLDEIEESERIRFLPEILRVSENCKESRILISSRDEDDIHAFLGTKSTDIRVDTHNANSLQTYVSSRCTKWIRSRNFTPQEKVEIVGLLNPIAAKAQGMFMYAQLVLKGLDLLDTIEEIRDELQFLPTDLDAAYGRIFSRINQKLPTKYLREKARRILGWVGCSPMPLSIQELEQALSIRVGDFSQSLRGYSILNLIRLCGPVVELVDEEVRFVHFTAKEYFFNPSVTNHLSLGQYSLSLAKTCVTYLCQPHHGPDQDKALTTTYLLAGVYRLHHFAADSWLKLTEFCCLSREVDKGSPDWTELIDLLQSLSTLRCNVGYLPFDEAADLPHLKHVQDAKGEVYELLCRETQFRKKCTVRLFKLGQGTWEASDPLTLRRTTLAINSALDIAACPADVHATHTLDSEPCFYAEINFNYGSRPFKCAFVGCRFHRIGFNYERLRKPHSKRHDRPWRCDVASCEYSEIGFLSRRMRDNHLDRFHKVDEPLEPVTMSNELGPDQLKLLALALIREDSVHAVQLLIPKLQLDWNLESLSASMGNSLDSEIIAETLAQGSCDMMHAVFDGQFGNIISNYRQPRKQFPKEVFCPAINSSNIEALTWLVCRTKPYLDGKSLESWKYDEVFAAALASESFASLVDCLEPITTDIFNRNVFPDCFQPRVVAATRRCPERENVLISLWRDLVGKDKIPQASTGCGLSSVATSTCSLRLASVLIDELGANLEYRGKKTQPAPLQRAAQKDTEENARFIDFLLHRGANPRVSYEKKDGTTREVIIEGRVHHMRGYKVVQLSEEKGAVGISKWLRKSWSQLCEETNGSRETNGN